MRQHAIRSFIGVNNNTIIVRCSQGNVRTDRKVANRGLSNTNCTASKRLDFPEPFLPTTTLVMGEKGWISGCCRKLRKLLIVICLMCMVVLVFGTNGQPMIGSCMGVVYLLVGMNERRYQIMNEETKGRSSCCSRLDASYDFCVFGFSFGFGSWEWIMELSQSTHRKPGSKMVEGWYSRCLRTKDTAATAIEGFPTRRGASVDREAIFIGMCRSISCMTHHAFSTHHHPNHNNNNNNEQQLASSFGFLL